MNLLVHCCCGPCAAGSLPQFSAVGYQPFCWFYNPNIQPYQEHKARRLAFLELMKISGLPYEAEGDYPLEQWLAAVAKAPEERCSHCYRSRLEATAQKAVLLGLPAFSTTLLISPYQDHLLLRELGEEYARRYQVEFVYLDLRRGFRAGQAQAREMGLYLQKYCGCVYSEKERYLRGAKSAKSLKERK